MVEVLKVIPLVLLNTIAGTCRISKVVGDDIYYYYQYILTTRIYKMTEDGWLVVPLCVEYYYYHKHGDCPDVRKLIPQA